MALSSEAKIVGPDGERGLPLEDFFTGVGKTVLQPDELLLEIVVPGLAPGASGTYIKHSPRGPIDLAIVNITVLLTMAPVKKPARRQRSCSGRLRLRR